MNSVFEKKLSPLIWGRDVWAFIDKKIVNPERFKTKKFSNLKKELELMAQCLPCEKCRVCCLKYISLNHKSFTLANAKSGKALESMHRPKEIIKQKNGPNQVHLLDKNILGNAGRGEVFLQLYGGQVYIDLKKKLLL